MKRKFNWNLLGGAILLGIAVLGFAHMVQNAMVTYGDMHSQLMQRSQLLDSMATMEIPADFDLILNMPADAAATAAKTSGDFKTLPDAKRAIVMNAFAKLGSLPPEKRRLFADNLERWKAMTPEEKMKVRITPR